MDGYGSGFAGQELVHLALQLGGNLLQAGLVHLVQHLRHHSVVVLQAVVEDVLVLQPDSFTGGHLGLDGGAVGHEQRLDP